MEGTLEVYGGNSIENPLDLHTARDPGSKAQAVQLMSNVMVHSSSAIWRLIQARDATKIDGRQSI